MRVATTYSLRPAGPEDIAALVAIDAANPAPWSARQFAQAIDDSAGTGRTVLVAHQENRPDGFIVYSQVLDEASIHNVAVHPHRRGEGVGRLLIVESLRRMKRAGAARCLLEVRQSNIAARQLYASTGFEEDGERKDYYPRDGSRENALLMSRTL